MKVEFVSLIGVVANLAVAMGTSTSSRGLRGEGNQATLDKPVKPLFEPSSKEALALLKKKYGTVGASLESTSPNVAEMLHGANIFEYDLFKGTGRTHQIFEALYTENKIVDGYLVPDGFSMIDTATCKLTAESTMVTGGASYVATQSDSVSVEGSANYGWVKGKFQASAEYANTVSKTETNEEFYAFSDMKCEVWKLMVEFGNLPNFTKGWVSAISGLHTGDWSPEAVISQFGTHYYDNAALGSRVQRKYTLSSTEWSDMEDSNIDITASASLSTKMGAGGSVSVMSEAEKEEASYFNQLSTSTAYETIGVDVPQNTNEGAIVNEWIAETRASSSTGIVQVFKLAPLLNLLDSSLLKTYNDMFAWLGYPQITKTDLQDIQNSLDEAMWKYCLDNVNGCNDPSKDVTPPKAATLNFDATLYPERSAGPSYTYDIPTEKELVGRLGNGGQATYDIAPKRFVLTFSNDGYSDLVGLEVVMENEKDDTLEWETQANPTTGNQCTIEIPQNWKVQDINVYFIGTDVLYIRGIGLKVGKDEWITCGPTVKDKDVQHGLIHLDSEEYLLNFGAAYHTDNHFNDPRIAGLAIQTITVSH